MPHAPGGCASRWACKNPSSSALPPLLLLSGIFVTLDYIAAPVFHAISGADPLFPVSFLPAFQSVAFWLLGAALWWIISTPMSYKAEKS